jgi:uncharacterized protein (TIGR02118 family)
VVAVVPSAARPYIRNDNEQAFREHIQRNIAMYKVSIMYPNQKAARFDFNYYQTKHMDLVKKHLQPFGLIKTDVEKGISGGGDQPAPYICIGNLYFESRDGYDRGIAEAGPILRGDISNFTDTTPVRQISEILAI